jgi:effector-binding domain-containing protein
LEEGLEFIKQSQLDNLHNFMAFLQKENNMPEHITIKELPEVLVASKRVVIKNHEQLNQEMPIFGKAMAKHGVKCVKPSYCFNFYHDGEYKPTDIDVEMCQAIVELKSDADGIVYKKLPPVPQAACVYHRGSYPTLGQTYALLMKWVEDHGYQAASLSRESYIDGPWNKRNEAEWLTEIQLPVKKK